MVSVVSVLLLVWCNSPPSPAAAWGSRGPRGELACGGLALPVGGVCARGGVASEGLLGRAGEAAATVAVEGVAGWGDEEVRAAGGRAMGCLGSCCVRIAVAEPSPLAASVPGPAARCRADEVVASSVARPM